MRSVEGEGGTIDEAITRALAALGVTRTQVEIDILENATPGVLGFGRKRARVRATIRPPLAAWSATEEAPAAAPRSEDVPRPDAFDGAGFVTELVRRMGWRGEVRASREGDTRTLEIESKDPAVISACDEEVLRAIAFLVNRIAERKVRDGTRFVVTLARPGAGGDLPAGARRAERARSRPGERRGGGKPRR